MIKCTTEKFLDIPANYRLLLYWYAVATDEYLLQARYNAYLAQDYSRATRLETLCRNSHKRINRRYQSLIKIGFSQSQYMTVQAA